MSKQEDYCEGWGPLYYDKMLKLQLIQQGQQNLVDSQVAEIAALKQEVARLRDHISEHLNAQNTGSLILARHYEPNELVYFDGAALDSGDNGGCLYLYRLKKLEADR